MSFLDLTPSWTDQPLTDPTLAADVVDLMVAHGDRQRGTFTVILCDPDDHYRATVTIELPPDPAPPTSGTAAPVPGSPSETCSTALAPVIPAVRTAPGTSLLLALGRPGPAHCSAVDDEWTQAATAICEAAAVRLLGFYIATPEGIHQPQIPERAAAA